MIMKLSSEKQNLVLNNQKLVYYMIHKLGIIPNSSEYEDIVSIGTIALVKAAITLDKSKKDAFSTYASRSIKNEILRYFKKKNKYKNEVSMENVLGEDGKGNNLRLLDIIEDPNSDFVQNIANKEECVKLINLVLNCLRGKKRIIFLYSIGGLSQREIAKRLKISQNRVSMIKLKVTKNIQAIAEQHLQYEKKFSMEIVGDEYRICFFHKEDKRVNKIIEEFLQNLTSDEKLNFKAKCNKEQTIIQIPAHPESFSFIAQVIKQIDDLGILEDYNKEEYIYELVFKKKNKIKQVREYMLSKDSFSVKDLKNHFPKYSANTINNALNLAKRKGLVTAISRGNYVVNKT